MNATKPPTKEQVRAGVETLAALAETIRELGQVPSGHLYVQVCGFLELNEYKRAIEILKGAGLVSEQGHLLRWVGPKIG